MKIRLHPDDCAKFGVDEVVEFDETRLGLREIVALQKATGFSHETLGKAFANKDEPDLEALAALVWLAIGRATGSRPDWSTFDVSVVDIEGDEPGKDSAPAPRTSKSRSGAGRRSSRTT